MQNQIKFLLNLPAEYLIDERFGEYVEVTATKDAEHFTARVRIPLALRGSIKKKARDKIIDDAVCRAKKIFNDIAAGDTFITPDGDIINSKALAL